MSAMPQPALHNLTSANVLDLDSLTTWQAPWGFKEWVGEPLVVGLASMLGEMV